MAIISKLSSRRYQMNIPACLYRVTGSVFIKLNLKKEREMYNDHFPSLFWSNLEVRVSGYFSETISQDYTLNSLYFQSLKIKE